MSRIDPRFETLEAEALAEGEIEGEPTWPERLRPIGRRHQAFVLLQPGRRLPDYLLADSLQFNDTTYLVEADISRIRSLATEDAILYVEAPRPMGSDLDTSVPATNADQLWTAAIPPLSGSGVVVGIIDEGGLDWRLADFQLPLSSDDAAAPPRTRILAIWDQSLRPAPWEGSPPGYRHGVEYDAAAINADLAGGRGIRHMVTHGSHATHVAGIAVGNGRSQSGSPARRHLATAPGVAHEADIIYVEVAKEPRTSLTNSAMLAKAIRYVFDKAQSVGKACVINVSLGTNGGAHDSESVVERTIDRMLEARGRVLVKSAGNEGVWDCHASTKLTTADPTRTLEWQIGRPGVADNTPNEMEIWYSSRDAMAVVVEAPNGDLAGPHQPGSQQWTSGPMLMNGEHLTLTTHRFHELNGAGYIHIYLRAAGGGRLQDGVWKVRLTASAPNDIKDGHIDAWIERDRRNPPSDQSIFIRNYVAIERTVSPPGTIRRGLTVGNYDHHAAAASGTSARGPTRDERRKPDLSAPGVNVWSSGARGVPGGAPDTRVRKSGTSMSAPHVTGICAQLLQFNPNLTSAQVAAALIASSHGVVYDPQLGFGLVDANATLGLLR
jgi:subtilisin family serine protease